MVTKSCINSLNHNLYLVYCWRFSHRWCEPRRR